MSEEKDSGAAENMSETAPSPVPAVAKRVPDAEERKATRRKFVEIAGGTALLGGLYGLTYIEHEEFAKPKGIRAPAKAAPTTPDIVCVEGNPESYGDITERAINELGGIEKFVKKGDKVVITPNMGWMRTPEQAAATHPDVLRRLVQLCERAGASRITCIDLNERWVTGNMTIFSKIVMRMIDKPQFFTRSWTRLSTHSIGRAMNPSGKPMKL